MRNIFEILEITPTTNFAEIKAAYQKKARLTHPDKGGQHELFVELNAAYQLVDDEKKLGQYVSLLNAESYLKAGNLCYEQQEYERAAQFYGEVLRLSPKNVTALTYRGYALRHLKRHAEAISCFGEVLFLAPSENIFQELVQINISDRNYDFAMHYINEWLKRFPENSKILSFRGEVFRCKRLFDLARSDLNKAILMDPISTYPRACLGALERDLNNVNGALVAYGHALNIDPNYSPALYAVAELHHGQKAWKQAFEYYQKAFVVPTNDINSKLKYAFCIYQNFFYISRAQRMGVRQQLDDILHHFPQESSALALSGEFYRLENCLGKAFDLFNRYLTLNPRDGYILSRRGYIFMQRNQFDLALADMNNALQTVPDNFWMTDTSVTNAYVNAQKGEIYRRQGKLMEAIELLESNQTMPAKLSLALCQVQLHRPITHFEFIKNIKLKNCGLLTLQLLAEFYTAQRSPMATVVQFEIQKRFKTEPLSLRELCKWAILKNEDAITSKGYAKNIQKPEELFGFLTAQEITHHNIAAMRRHFFMEPSVPSFLWPLEARICARKEISDWENLRKRKKMDAAKGKEKKEGEGLNEAGKESSGTNNKRLKIAFFTPGEESDPFEIREISSRPIIGNNL